MKADALCLAATLNSPEVDFYTIPQYQRPFKWEIDNFETLWEDLTEAYREFVAAKEQGKVPEYYFLGPVVFVRNAGKKSYDIIDGQQRTTTFHVLLWYLSRRLKDETEKGRVRQILTFLGKDPTTNNEIKNFDYGVKKAFYEKHLKDWSIARIVSDKDEWTPEDIRLRASQIADWAEGYWRL